MRRLCNVFPKRRMQRFWGKRCMRFQCNALDALFLVGNPVFRRVVLGCGRVAFESVAWKRCMRCFPMRGFRMRTRRFMKTLHDNVACVVSRCVLFGPARVNFENVA